MNELLRTIGRPLIYATMRRADDTWKPYQEICSQCGGEAIALGSPLQRGSCRTVTLRGYILTPRGFSGATYGQLSQAAARAWDNLDQCNRGVTRQYKTRPSPESVREVVLIFPGNAGAAEACIGQAVLHLTAGRHVQLINPRGFSNSEGSPDVEGSHLDVESIVDFAIDQCKSVRLIFEGYSLGSHLALWGATYAAKKYGPHAVGGVLMDRPFGTMSTAADVGAGRWLGLGVLAQRLFPYDNISLAAEYAQQSQAPLLIVRGTKDAMMNPSGATTTNQKTDRNAEAIFRSFFKERYGHGEKRSSVRASVIHDVAADHLTRWWQTDAKVTKAWIDALFAHHKMLFTRDDSDSSSVTD